LTFDICPCGGDKNWGIWLLWRCEWEKYKVRLGDKKTGLCGEELRIPRCVEVTELFLECAFDIWIGGIQKLRVRLVCRSKNGSSIVHEMTLYFCLSAHARRRKLTSWRLHDARRTKRDFLCNLEADLNHSGLLPFFPYFPMLSWKSSCVFQVETRFEGPLSKD
jgi:hypothetical protein